MPLYELLCLSKPALPRAELVAMMQRVSLVIMQRGGVLTNLLSYGEQHLAYDLRRPFERYSKVCAVAGGKCVCKASSSEQGQQQRLVNDLGLQSAAYFGLWDSGCLSLPVSDCMPGSVLPLCCCAGAYLADELHGRPRGSPLESFFLGFHAITTGLHVQPLLQTSTCKAYCKNCKVA